MDVSVYVSNNKIKCLPVGCQTFPYFAHKGNLYIVKYSSPYYAFEIQNFKFS